MATRKKKKSTIEIILSILSIILVLMVLLKFDAVANVIDPDGKIGIKSIVNDGFPIVLGLTLVLLGVAAAATVWVGIGLITVGVIMVLVKVYTIYNRKDQSLDVE